MPRKSKRDEEEELDLSDEEKREMGIGEPVSYDGYAIEGLGQVSPAVPIRWAEIPTGDWPYETPEIEFVRSPFPLDIQTLCQRWKGLWKPFEIELEYGRRDWPRLRAEHQDKLAEVAYANSLVNDSEYQRRIIESDFQRLSSVIERLHADITQGVEYRPLRGSVGIGMGYVKMPMTGETKAKLVAKLNDTIKLRRLTMGMATEIAERQHTHTLSLADEMRRMRAERDPGYAGLLDKAGLKGRIFESTLPAGAVIHDVTEEARSLPLATHLVEDRTNGNGSS